MRLQGPRDSAPSREGSQAEQRPETTARSLEGALRHSALSHGSSKEARLSKPRAVSLVRGLGPAGDAWAQPLAGKGHLGGWFYSGGWSPILVHTWALQPEHLFKAQSLELGVPGAWGPWSLGSLTLRSLELGVPGARGP